MKNIITCAEKALVLSAILAVSTLSFAQLAFADDSDYSGDSYAPTDYSGDSYSPTEYYSGDSYSPTEYYSGDSYSPTEYYSGDAYSPTTYSSSYSGDAYSPTTYSAGTYAYTPSYSSTYSYVPSYTAPTYSTGYDASYSYVPQTYSYSYTPSTYSYNPPVYQQPPVYNPPVYNPPVYNPPVTNTIQASCYPQVTNNGNNYNGNNINTVVTWIANATGGNGSFAYSWSGTDGLSGLTGSSVNVNYTNSGTKTGSVLVTSGGQSITVNCGSTYVNGYQNYSNNYSVSCTPNVTSAAIGQTITWTANVYNNGNTYGNGYNGGYTYNWTDNSYGNNVVNSSNGPVYTSSYSYAGSKAPTVTVYGINTGSGNTTQTVTCQPANVYTNGYNAAYTYNYPIVPTGNLASLSQVSLSQVPYTGITDSASFWEFMLGLLLASLVGTWYFMKVYGRGKRRYAIDLFKQANLAKRNQIAA